MLAWFGGIGIELGIGIGLGNDGGAIIDDELLGAAVELGATLDDAGSGPGDVFCGLPITATRTQQLEIIF